MEVNITRAYCLINLGNHNKAMLTCRLSSLISKESACRIGITRSLALCSPSSLTCQVSAKNLLVDIALCLNRVQITLNCGSTHLSLNLKSKVITLEFHWPLLPRTISIRTKEIALSWCSIWIRRILKISKSFLDLCFSKVSSLNLTWTHSQSLYNLLWIRMHWARLTLEQWAILKGKTHSSSQRKLYRLVMSQECQLFHSSLTELHQTQMTCTFWTSQQTKCGFGQILALIQL